MIRPETPNEIGSALEKHVAQRLNGQEVVQSGGGKWVKLDVKDSFRLAISCKATKALKQTSMRAIASLWREAVRGARGFQGHGDGARPAMVFEVNGEVLMLARLDDWADLATDDTAPYIEPSKGEQRRNKSRRSLLGG